MRYRGKAALKGPPLWVWVTAAIMCVALALMLWQGMKAQDAENRAAEPEGPAVSAAASQVDAGVSDAAASAQEEAPAAESATEGAAAAGGLVLNYQLNTGEVGASGGMVEAELRVRLKEDRGNAQLTAVVTQNGQETSYPMTWEGVYTALVPLDVDEGASVSVQIKVDGTTVREHLGDFEQVASLSSPIQGEALGGGLTYTQYALPNNGVGRAEIAPDCGFQITDGGASVHRGTFRVYYNGEIVATLSARTDGDGRYTPRPWDNGVICELDAELRLAFACDDGGELEYEFTLAQYVVTAHGMEPLEADAVPETIWKG